MKILYVEDDARDADLTRRALARDAPHIQLDVATCLAEAEARLAGAADFDVVVTDLALPDGSGLELVASIRKRALPVAVAALTGTNATESAVAALKAGADDYLVKRDDYLARLPDALSSALARFRAEAARRARPLRVIYAEDDTSDVELTRRHFARHAAHVHLDVVPDAKGILALLPVSPDEPPRYDVVLLDYRLADRNALDVLKVLREERRLEIPVVVVSGQADGEIASHAFRFGSADFVVKQPGYLFQLTAAVEAAHDRARLAREQVALEQSEAFNAIVLNALTASIAVVDADGVIVSVNESWRRFALDNGGTQETAAAVGTSYLTACQAAVSVPAARAALEGIRGVLDGSRAHFSLEYSCSSPDEERWFSMVAAPTAGARRGAVISHENITSRKLAADALRASEERFRSLFEQAAVGMAQMDSATGRFLRVNRKYGDILGYSAAELLELDFMSVSHPGELSAHLALMDRLRAGEQQEFAMEKRLYRKDGSVAWIKLNVSPIWKADGSFEHHIAVVEDITARKTTVDALRLLSTGMAHLSGETLLGEVACQIALLVGADIGFVGRLLTPRTPRIRTVGLSVDGHPQPQVEYELAGSPCEAVIGKKAALFSQDVQRQFPADPTLVELGVSGYAAVPLFDVKGSPLGHIGVKSRRPLRDPEQVIALLHLFAVRTGAEIERQESAARFQDLFDFSPDAILMVDQGGLITMANRQAAKLFGRAHDELIGLPVEELMPKLDRHGHVAQRRRFLSATAPRQMGSRVSRLFAQHKDGSTFPVDIGLSPMQSDDGPLVVAAVRDISERVRTEEERAGLEGKLREARKMEAIGTLAGGIAHDFNNLLAVVIANIEVARDDVGAEHPALASLDDIELAAVRGTELVRQILAFSRKERPKRAEVSLRPLLEETAKMLRVALRAGVELDVRLDAAAPTVLADATQLQRVLMNLGINARDALDGSSGRITITLDDIVIDDTTSLALRKGRYARIVVGDNGRGIDPSTLDRIFEPFFTTKEVGKGTGLGLAVVHGLVQAHDGAVTVESRPGAGTRFNVYLPAATAPSALSEVDGAQRDAAARLAGARHVLFLDDEPSLVASAIRLLEPRGYRVTGFTQAAEALEAVRSEPTLFDVVVTDSRMPDLSGLEVAREIFRIRPELPVVLMSGHFDERARAELASAGVRHLLDKPCSATQLEEVLEELARGPTERDP